MKTEIKMFQEKSLRQLKNFYTMIVIQFTMILEVVLFHIVYRLGIFVSTQALKNIEITLEEMINESTPKT
jgi:hypothetical protein